MVQVTRESDTPELVAKETPVPHAQGLPALSIIIPLYNYATVVAHAICSVLEQITEECELLVINDGSTDESDAVVSTLLEEHGFAYHSKDNEGLAATRNYGIDHSTGRYIVFLDADDYFCPDAIKEFLKNIASSDSAIMVFAHESAYPDGKIKYKSPPSAYPTCEEAFIAYGKKDFSLSSGSTIFSREVFNEIRFPEHLKHAEDQPVYALLVANYEFKVDGFPTCVVVKHQESMRKDADAAVDAGLQTVDYLFSHSRLPAEFVKYRNVFLSGRMLSIFRTLYQSGRYRNALRAYREAIAVSPSQVMNLKYLTKALRAFISSSINQ